MMPTWQAILTPNASVSSAIRRILVAGWLISALLVWQFGDVPLLPQPGDTFERFTTFWGSGIVYQLLVSITTMFKALFFAFVIALSLAYLTVVPVFKPFSTAVAALRFLGLTGLTLAFTMMTSGGGQLKVAIITFGVSVFFLKDMVRVVDEIPREHYDHARTLGMGPWRVMWEVVILGTFDQAIDSLRVNAAMGWMMLTTVEALDLSNGGIGAELWKMQRQMDLTTILAIQLMIFVIGLIQDWSLGFIKDQACPYARLDKARH